MTRRPDVIIDCVILLAVWVFMTLLTMPWGNFPLNDDWNYGRSVKALIDERRLLITHWSLAASLTHIMLGWLPSVLFGFSFDALRSVSIVGGLVATICTYFACLRLGTDRITRLFAALTLMVNPIFFNLSMTYMTDVPFLMLAGLSVLLYAKTFSNKTLTWRLIGVNCALAVFTCLSRQTGIVLPIGFLLAVATAGHAWGERSRMIASLKAALPALAGIAATSGFQIWLSNTVGTLHSYRVERAWIEQLLQKGPTYVAEHCAMNFIVICIYLGTFLFPLMIMLYPRFVAALSGKERKFALIMFGEPLILLGLGLVLTHSKMPLGDNILFDLGLGPLLLGGQQPLEAWGKGPESFWILVTICGVAGASAMISILVIVLSRLIGKRAFTRFDADATTTAMLLFTSLIYIALIAFRGFFDRYLLFPLLLLLPVFCVALRLQPPLVSPAATTAENSPTAGEPVTAGSVTPEPAFSKPPLPAAFRALPPFTALALLLYGCFGVAGTHDYFEWNRARWRAAHDLVDVKQVSPMDIDGGLEFNGWWGYDPKFRSSIDRISTEMRHGDAYLLTMRNVDGYDVLSRYAFQRWLPGGSGEIVVLKKRGF